MENNEVMQEQEVNSGEQKATDFINGANAAAETVSNEYEKYIAELKAENKTYQEYITKNVMNGGSMTVSEDDNFDIHEESAKFLKTKPGAMDLETLSRAVKIARADQRLHPDVPNLFVLKGDNSYGANEQMEEVLAGLETLIEEANGNPKEFELLLRNATSRGTR